MQDNKFLDDYIENIKIDDINITESIKEEVLNKAFDKIDIQKKFSTKNKYLQLFSVKKIVAACLTIIILTGFIPSTPVNALYQRLFQFVPGFGVVQTKEDYIIQSALKEAVKVKSGDDFLEIKYAYIANNMLTVSINTNIGFSHLKNDVDKKTILEYSSGETMPRAYLLVDNERIELTNYSVAGPSLETKIYSIEGSFVLSEDLLNNNSFEIGIGDFGKTARIVFSKVKQGETPDSMGNTITINDMIVFADMNRINDVTVVKLNAVAPNNIKNLRFYMFNHEKVLFDNEVLLVDSDGNTYVPDDELRKQHNDDINSFYFNIPQDKNDLELVIPQLIYEINYNASLKAKMPEANKVTEINKEIQVDKTTIVLESMSLLLEDSSIVPDDFQNHSVLKLDISAYQTEDSLEKVLRVIPDIQIPDSFFDYYRPSSSGYAELWPLDVQSGFYLTTFDDIDTTNKVLINFEVEYVIVGPFNLKLE